MKGSRAIPRVFVAGAKVLVVFSLLALSLSTTYAASPEAFSDSDLLGILMLGGAVNGGALLVGAGRFAPWTANALLAVLAVIGIAGSYAVHTDLILVGPVLLWALLGGAGFALFVAFGAIDRSPSVGMALAALGSLAVGIYTAELWFKANRTAQGVVVTGDRSNLRDVTFVRRPNIYFVSFDGMAPRVLLRKYMGLESTPFHDLFERRFRRFENFFVNALYTTHSLQLPFALDERTYVTMIREYREKTGRDDVVRLVAGQSPAPLLGILKKNGYETSTAYEAEHFGKLKGPYVDHYFTGRDRTVCNLLDRRVRAFSFWGYCPMVGDDRIGHYRTQMRVVDHVGRASLRDGPQFAMAHIYVPGHTSASFQYDEENLRWFRAHYRRGSAVATGLLAHLLAHLDEHDPDAILLVFGDHGPGLSIGVAFADAPDFVVQDYFGALGGVHPPDACEEWFDEAQQRRGYLTLLDAVHTVVRCLSGGESALRAPPEDYYVGGWQGKVPDGDRRTYKEFLYE